MKCRRNLIQAKRGGEEECTRISSQTFTRHDTTSDMTMMTIGERLSNLLNPDRLENIIVLRSCGQWIMNYDHPLTLLPSHPNIG